MADQQEQNNDADAFDAQKEEKMKEGAGAHHDNAEFPSGDDIASRRGEGTGRDSADVPGKDEIASDVDSGDERLHGSLHGRWNATDQSE